MLLSTRVSLIFSATYLQGENSINENKDRDSYFIDPFLIDPSKVSGPVSNIIFVPSFSEPELSSFGLAPENWMTDIVYSRKQVVVYRLLQV